ncbi:peptidoglycan-binding protein [Virgibacillus xinjiangensis]|uniref:Peptidoglycan-binding protein n=1 Tax=Virgibacillus xinjiangensis TaxID=393090 RepID=A0ABV7CU21_9BACI
MKKRNSMILTIMLLAFSLFYFSPQITEANTEDLEAELQEEEQSTSVDNSDREVSSEIENDEATENSSFDHPSDTNETTEVDEEHINEDSNAQENETAIEDSEEENSEAGDTRTESQQADSDIAVETNEDSEAEPKSRIMMQTLSEPSYSDGDSGNHIVELKEDLVRLGFASWSDPSPYYGSVTAGVVKDFQDYYDLPVTGVADSATRNKMKRVLNPPYMYGDRGEPVVSLKEDLVELGYANWSNPSIYYGSVTAGVVEDFQKEHKLAVDGIAGAKTLAALEDALQNDNNTSVASVSQTSRYSDGDSGDHIVKLKEDLVRLGFASWSDPSPYYGNITGGVVEEFQDYYDLPVTGVADSTTRNKMSQVLNPPYMDGDRGEPVVSLKEDLVELGYANWSNPSIYYGSVTAGVVEDFQRSYGLAVDGIAGSNTLTKIEEVLEQDPLYQNGDSGDHIVELKEDLVQLGFANWSNPSPYYGSITAGVVEDFQSYYDLPITGIADVATRNKISEVLNPPYRDGDRGEPVVELKEDLVELGYANWSSPSQYYGNVTASVVEDFQSDYDLTVDGIAGSATLSNIEEALDNLYSIGDSGEHIVELKKDLTTLGFANWSDPTPYYGNITASVVKDFQRAYGLTITGTADDITLQTIEDNIVKVFLDPGHGGTDPGAQAYGLDEKDIVLDIALEAGQILRDEYTGAEIHFSRTDDVFVELEERARMANNWDADYFVSFHVNAWMGLGSGFESYIYDGGASNETTNRQNDIHEYIVDRIPVGDRGKKQANFSVLRNTDMPAILLEYMFIDNTFENDYLSKSYNRTNLAQITADAIAQSYGLSRR